MTNSCKLVSQDRKRRKDQPEQTAITANPAAEGVSPFDPIDRVDKFIFEESLAADREAWRGTCLLMYS